MAPLRSRALGAAIVIALVLAATAAAARLSLDPGTLDVYRFAFVQPVEIEADVDVVPVALQKKSEGDHVTVFAGLPFGYSPSNVVATTVRLCLAGGECVDGGYKPQSVAAGTRLKLLFAREDVIALVDHVESHTVVVFTLTGLVGSPPATFGGGDQVTVLGD